MFKKLYSGRPFTLVGWQFSKKTSHLTKLVCFPVSFLALLSVGSLASKKIVSPKIHLLTYISTPEKNVSINIWITLPLAAALLAQLFWAAMLWCLQQRDRLKSKIRVKLCPYTPSSPQLLLLIPAGFSGPRRFRCLSIMFLNRQIHYFNFLPKRYSFLINICIRFKFSG